MLTPTAEMKPVITDVETKRRKVPSLSSPAMTITTPVSTDRVKRALPGSSRPPRSTSATMMAMAPVPCTAMKAVLVNRAPPTTPNR